MPEGYLPAALYMQPMYGCWNYDICCTLYSSNGAGVDSLWCVHAYVYAITGHWTNMCMCVYCACACGCVYVCLCTCVCTHTVCVYTYSMCVWYVHYVCACMRTACVCVCVCACVCVCVCVCDDRDVASLLSKATQSALRSS